VPGVNSATAAVSVARVESQADWTEPGQAPNFMNTTWYCGATAIGNVLIQVMDSLRDLQGKGLGAGVVLSGDLPARGGLELDVPDLRVTACNLSLSTGVEESLLANLAFEATC